MPSQVKQSLPDSGHPELPKACEEREQLMPASGFRPSRALGPQGRAELPPGQATTLLSAGLGAAERERPLPVRVDAWDPSVCWKFNSTSMDKGRACTGAGAWWALWRPGTGVLALMGVFPGLLTGWDGALSLRTLPARPQLPLLPGSHPCGFFPSPHPG